MDLNALFKKYSQMLGGAAQNVGKTLSSVAQSSPPVQQFRAIQQVSNKVAPPLINASRPYVAPVVNTAKQVWQGSQTPFGTPTPKAPKIPILGQTGYEFGQTLAAAGFDPAIQAVGAASKFLPTVPKIAIGAVNEASKIAGPWGQGLSATTDAWKKNAIAQGVDPKTAEGVATVAPFLMGSVRPETPLFKEAVAKARTLNPKTLRDVIGRFYQEVMVNPNARGDITRGKTVQNLAEKLGGKEVGQLSNTQLANWFNLVLQQTETGNLPKVERYVGLSVKNVREGLSPKGVGGGGITGKIIDERLVPLADKDGMITVYRAAPKFPTDKLSKDTFVATDPNKANYYAQSHYTGDPQDITTKAFRIPASQLKRGGSNDAWQLKEDFSLSAPPPLNQGTNGLSVVSKSKKAPTTNGTLPEDIGQIKPAEVPPPPRLPGESATGYTTPNRPITTPENVGGQSPSNPNISQDSQKYIDEMIQNREKARGKTSDGIIGGAKNFLDEIKKKFVDSTAPIEDILSAAQKKYKYQVRPQNDVSLQIDRVARADTLAGQFVRDNGFENIIKNAPDLNALDQYLIAKQAKKVASLGRETGRDLAKDEQLVAELGGIYEPYAKEVTNFSRKLLNYSVEKGLISKELADDLVKMYPDYVPLKRVFSELEKSGYHGTGRGPASLSRQTIVQKLKGSDREIESPIESLLLKTTDAFNQGERNVAARQLASYRDLPGFEGLIRELKPGESAVHTISYLDNGVKRTFETTPEIAAAAKSLNIEQIGLLEKIFRVPVRALQLGATGLNIPFVVTNVVKDQLTGFINSRRALNTSLLNPLNFTRALFSAVKHDKLYEEVVRNAAGGTSFDIARSAPELTVKRIRAGRNIGSKAAYTVTHPLELLRAAENIIGRSEEIGRIQNYKGMKGALLKEGRTVEDATLLAAKAARENTANFLRKGEWGRVLNSTIPFFNAGIQGARQLVRSIQNNPKGAAVKLTTAVFLPVATTTAWNLSDPKRKEVYNDIDKFEKENNIIIVPDNPTRDEQGRWNVIKIPLPPGLSNLASNVRRPIEAASGLDAVSFQELAANIITAGTSIDVTSGNKLVTGFTPQALKGGVEDVFNKNSFTGKEIVPQSMRNLPPEEQVRSYTSGTARKIGGVLNVSPLRVENFVKTTFGGLGSQALNLSDSVMASRGKIPKEQVGGENAIQNLQRRFTKASGGASVDLADSQLAKGMSSRATVLYDALHSPRPAVDENGLPSDKSDRQDSMANASIRLAEPSILAREAADARARARLDGSMVNPLYDLPWDKQRTVLTITSLPPGNQDKKDLVKANISWLEPYYNKRDVYVNDLKAKGIITNTPGQIQAPQPSVYVQQQMDNKNWKDPQVRAYLDANTQYQNAERAKLGLPPLAGFTPYKRKPTLKKIKAVKVKIPKLGKVKAVKARKPKKIKQYSLKKVRKLSLT